MAAPTAPHVDLTGRTMVVTGTAPGSIGGETARILREWGATVVTTTRSTPVGRTTHPLDLTSVASVQAFASWYGENHGPLDVLVNNAGVHLDLMSRWKEPHLLEDGFEVHWRTNFLGTMHLTSLLMPFLAPGGRVVNVSSKLHTRGKNSWVLSGLEPYGSWDAYGTSKLALQHATNELQRRHPELVANSLHPGEVYTDIATKGLAGHRFVGGVRKVLAPVERRMLQTPVEGAQTSVLVATAPDLTGGRYFAKCVVKEPNPELRDTAVSAELYDRTQTWIASL
jgi:retinol dehydrogenase-12